MSGAKKVFLSYSHRDRAQVKALYARLVAAGCDPWMDDTDLKGGDEWQPAIGKAIHSSDHFLACLSPEAASRRGVIQREIHEALDARREKLDSDNFLIPVRLQPCELPESLAKFQCVDLFESDGFERLAAAMGLPATPPPPPPAPWRRWAAAGALALVALAAVLLLRGVAGHRDPFAEFASARANPRAGAAAEASEAPRIGLTLWRLRPAASRDPSGVRLLVQDPAESSASESTPERVDPDAPIERGEKLRLSIESQQHGYLYVIDREQFEGGTMGDPYLIFPTRRTNAGDNEMRAGRVVEIPSAFDHPPYFTVRSQSPNYRGELLTLLMAPNPLEGLATEADRTSLDRSLFENWQRRWNCGYERSARSSPAGTAMTLAEAQAGRSATRLLVQDDPTPQTIYSLKARVDQPRMFNILLTAAQ